MASRRDEQRVYAQLKIMRLIAETPSISTRQLAEAASISHGSTHYILAALADKGLLKVQNFSNNPQKLGYAYLLTPRGVREKTRLTLAFIERKRKEFEELKAEIEALEEDAEQWPVYDQITGYSK